MRCPSCGFENPQGSIFCQQCGSRFQQAAAPTVVCSRCHAVQPANLRFCTTCGNTLQAPAAAPAPAPQMAPAQPVSGFGQQPGFGQPAGGFVVQPSSHLGHQPTPAVPPQAVPTQQHSAAAFAPPVQGSPMGRAGAELADKQAAVGPVCWRCRGQGDAGHEFCKFCGARYSDAPGAAQAAAPQVAQPVQPAQPAQPAMARGPQPASGGFGGAAAQPAPAAFVAQPAPMPMVSPARLVSILKDGTDGQTFPIQSEQFDLGRAEGDVVLADDPYLSPRHARIRRQGEQFVVRDLDSFNGVYMRLRETVDLGHGDMILVGQQVLRLEVLDDVEAPFGPAGVHGVLVFGTPESPRVARLMQYTTEGLVRDVFYLYRNETVLGRENGDVVFTDDPFLSRRHAAIRFDRANRKFAFSDLGSSNGSFLRLRGERVLSHLDQFRVGRHLFRFELASAMAGQGAR